MLLKECRDIQLRCGSAGHDYASEDMAVPAGQFTAETDAEKVISERLVFFPCSTLWCQPSPFLFLFCKG